MKSAHHIANRIRDHKRDRDLRVFEDNAMARYEECAGCGQFHEIMKHGKVWLQSRHVPCSQGLKAS